MCEVSHQNQLWHHVCRVSDAYFESRGTAAVSFMMCMHVVSSETNCNFIILVMYIHVNSSLSNGHNQPVFYHRSHVNTKIKF